MKYISICYNVSWVLFVYYLHFQMFDYRQYVKLRGGQGGAFQKLEIFSVIFKIFQSSYWTKLLICCCKLYWKVSVCLNIYQSYSWNWIATNKLFLVQWLQFNFNRKTDMYSNELKVDITLLL